MQNQLQSGSTTVPVSVLCRLLAVARSTTYYQPRGRHLEPQCDPVCVEAIRAVFQAHPTYGVRMTHARLTKGQGMIVNRKKVHLIMRLHRWTCRQRHTGRRPRVQHLKSIAAAPNQRWATDIATVDCGRDGWCAFVPVNLLPMFPVHTGWRGRSFSVVGNERSRELCEALELAPSTLQAVSATQGGRCLEQLKQQRRHFESPTAVFRCHDISQLEQKRERDSCFECVGKIGRTSSNDLE